MSNTGSLVDESTVPTLFVAESALLIPIKLHLRVGDGVLVDLSAEIGLSSIVVSRDRASESTRYRTKVQTLALCGYKPSSHTGRHTSWVGGVIMKEEPACKTWNME